VYASMVGLGFAMTENVQYYALALQAGPDVLGATFVLRGLILPALHPLFTSLTGIGLVLGLRATNRRTRIVAPLAGLAGAMLLHSAWNTSPVIFGPLLILPVLVMVVMLVRRSIRQEASVVRRYLPEAMVPREDVERLGSFRARFADSIRALREGGLRGLEARQEYVAALGDLAFDRYRAAEGVMSSSDDRAREQLARLRREWRSPTTR
jgi:protease PrsW